MMNKAWHNLDYNEVLEKIESTPNGLSSEEVKKRLARYGYNEIPEVGKKHWLFIFLKQYNSLLIWVLFIAAVISWTTGHFADVYIILAVILINTMIGFVQELKAESAVSSLKSMLVAKAKVIRDGEKTTIKARELVPGDIIILEEGDSIPADARLIESKNLRAIEAPLTGESVPVNKDTNPLPENTVLADQKNMVRKSTFIAGGYAHAVVTGTAMDTAIGEIAKTLGKIKIQKTNFQKKTDVLAKQMAVIAIASATLLFTVSYFVRQQEWEEVLLISIAALVSAIPEGLPAVLSIVLAIGANRMAKRKAIIREFTATETLGAVTTIITDKTGTLTQNTLTVRKVGIYGEEDIRISGEGWIPAGNFNKGSSVIDTANHSYLDKFLQICAFSNNSEIKHDKKKDLYNLIGDPTEGALLVLARKAGWNTAKLPEIQKVDDLPFNSTIKMRATLVEQDKDLNLLVVGAPEKVLEKSVKVHSKSGAIEMTSEIAQNIRERIEQWTGEAMRVIALAYREEKQGIEKIDENKVDNLVFAGIVGMIDPPRPDVKESVAACHKAGIRVIMATGDHINTAIAIAKATGILTKEDEGKTKAITEKQLLELDEREFDKVIQKINVFARLTPNMKLKIAERLQHKGELIAMTGDGVNDAPALKKADVGVAMGIMGTDVARDAANVVLSDDNFSTIVSAVEQGRIVFNNTRHTSFFLLTTNFAEITTLVSAVAIGMPIPLTATQILWLNLVTDGTCTTAMATESGHGDELEAKPVNPEEKILNKEVLPFIIINSVIMAILALSAFHWFFEQDGNEEKARSAAFIVMAFCQLFNMFNMRSLKKSIFKIGPFSNNYINLAIVASIIIQVLIIEVPFFERLFGFDPISFLEFVSLAALSSITLWAGEVFKYVSYIAKKIG
jgi:P-type Ca2+ transporter type 2C